MTADERRTLTRAGFPHGIVGALRDHWSTKGYERSFSAQAIYHLVEYALEGITGAEFFRIAERIEGEDGARLLTRIVAAAARETRSTDDGSDGEDSDSDVTEPGESEPGPAGAGATTSADLSEDSRTTDDDQ